MEILEIIILGIVQGIAEFLPVSSSAHLIILRNVFGIGNSLSGDIELAFDVALHLGTLLAIIVYFYKDLFSILKEGITKGIKTINGKIMWLIVIATIPGALAGLLFEDAIESFFRQETLIIAIVLIIVGIIIYLADKKNNNNRSLNNLNLKDSIFIGIGQSLALIPGFSRSGTTIAIARSLKINKEDAAKFSFYLSIPIVLGAVFLTIIKEGTIALLVSNLFIFIIGILISFVVGLLTINFLLQYLRKNDFKIFMWYRLILGLITIGLIIF
jgi:undecaprenyl-diphosphatase